MYSSYLGGSGQDQTFGIAVDSSGTAYISGNTGSTDFPLLNHFAVDVRWPDKATLS